MRQRESASLLTQGVGEVFMAIQQSVPLVSETEVMSKGTRRRFSAEYKLKILDEAGRCTARGELGGLLRREGLYSSHLANWRAELSEHGRAGLSGRKRGPAPKVVNPYEAALAAKERENAALRAANIKLQLICDVQKKVSLLLGIVQDEVPTKAEAAPRVKS